VWEYKLRASAFHRRIACLDTDPGAAAVDALVPVNARARRVLARRAQPLGRAWPARSREGRDHGHRAAERVATKSFSRTRAWHAATRASAAAADGAASRTAAAAAAAAGAAAAGAGAGAGGVAPRELKSPLGLSRKPDRFYEVEQAHL
jgi:hypothetical protein